MFKRPTNVLVVDDEKDLVQMIVETLREVNETAYGAYSGEECLRVLDKNGIDVIILDIKMPGMDGMETLQEIKKRFPLVEVIMLTGHGTIDTSVQCRKLGAFDYILKPADFADLVEKIRAAREKRNKQKERIRQAEARALLTKSRRGVKNPLGSREI